MIVVKFLSQTKLSQDGDKKTMVKTVKSFFNIHSYKETCNTKPTAGFNYVRN